MEGYKYRIIMDSKTEEFETLEETFSYLKEHDDFAFCDIKRISKDGGCSGFTIRQ